MKITDIVIEDLHDLEPEEKGFLGTMLILGVPHHVMFVEVADTPQEDGGLLQEPVNDPDGRYQDMQNVYDGRYQTVQLPGHPGRRFCVMVVPYCH